MKPLFLNVFYAEIEVVLILFGVLLVSAINGVDRTCTHTALQKTLQGDGTWKYFCQYVKDQNRIILLQGSEFNHKCSTCKCSQKGLECCQPKPPMAPTGCITIGADCDYRQVLASDGRTPCDLGMPNIESSLTGNNLTKLLNSKDAFVFFSTNTQVSKQDKTAPQQAQKKDSENEPEFPFMKYLNLLLMQDSSNPQGSSQGHPQSNYQGHPQSNYQGHLQNQPQGYQPTNSKGIPQGSNVNTQSGTGPDTNVKRLETNSVQIVAAQPDKIDMDFTSFVQNVLAMSGNGLSEAQQASLLQQTSSALNSNKEASGSGFTNPQQKTPVNRKRVNSGFASGLKNKLQSPLSDNNAFVVNYDKQSPVSAKTDLQMTTTSRHSKETTSHSNGNMLGGGFQDPPLNFSTNSKNDTLNSDSHLFGNDATANLQQIVPTSSKTIDMHSNSQSVTSGMTNVKPTSSGMINVQPTSSPNKKTTADITEVFNARRAFQRPAIITPKPVINNGNNARRLNIKPIRKNELLRNKQLLRSEIRRLKSLLNEAGDKQLESNVNHVATARPFHALLNRTHARERGDFKSFISDSPPASYISSGLFHGPGNVPSGSHTATPGPFDAITKASPVGFESPTTTATVTDTFDLLENLVNSGNTHITTSVPFDTSTHTPIEFSKNNRGPVNFQSEGTSLNAIRKTPSNDGQLRPSDFQQQETSLNAMRKTPSNDGQFRPSDFQQQVTSLNAMRKTPSNDGQFRSDMSVGRQGYTTRNGQNVANTSPSIVSLEKSANIDNLSLQDSISLLLALEKLERKGNNEQNVNTNKPNIRNDNTNMFESAMYRNQPTIKHENTNMGGTTLHSRQPNSRGENSNMASRIRQQKPQPIRGTDFDLNLLANLLSSELHQSSIENSKTMSGTELLNNKPNNLGKIWPTQNSKTSPSATSNTGADSPLSNILDQMIRQKMMQYLFKEKQTDVSVSNTEQSGSRNVNNPTETQTGDPVQNLVDKMVQQKMMRYLFNEKQTTNLPPILNTNKQGGSNKETFSNTPTKNPMDSFSSQQLLFKMLMNPEGPLVPEGGQSQMAAMNMFNNNMFPATEGTQAMSENLPLSMLLRMNSEAPSPSPMHGLLHSLK